ncbi:hypothetical protein E3G42_004672 [Mycobacteroides abscessus]|nr:hypothetical protein [Mycobacteroides abscessus]SHS59255.1 Uncharacterised protein [Mycobacteroides abscessus subsp. abscessus]MBE5486341.1 hypothetical protein [Mycobacteroides abscessus]QOF26384.1 hypothetical protein E3G42_004672 [Mycobacteroides abscessus]CPW01343.1 Uncharacterised protein [Mycobacteroides abscessus]
MRALLSGMQDRDQNVSVASFSCRKNLLLAQEIPL